jgi:predicted nucleic acid-binding protein
MNHIAIDTNAYTAFLSGNELIRDKIAYASDILLPVIVLGELYYGFHKGTKAQENIASLAIFLGDRRVRVGEVNAAVAKIYGDIQNKLRLAGKSIPSNDLWIAATCIESSYELITQDKHFNGIVALELSRF